MSIPLGVTGLKLRRAREYFYEKLVYTGWPFNGTGGSSSLKANATTTFFDVQNWNQRGQPATRAEIDMLQMSQQSSTGVTLTFTTDSADENSLNEGDLTAARAGSRFMAADVRAVDHLAAKIVNGNAAVASFVGNMSVATRRLTALDKIFASRVAGLQSARGSYDLTSAEQVALANVGLTMDQAVALVSKGTMPFSTESWLRVLIEAHTIRLHEDFFTVSVDADDNPFATYQAAMQDNTRGRFIVLERFAAEGATNVLWTINRDDDTDSYHTMDGAAFQQSDDAPWEMFLAGFDHISLHAKNDTGATGTNTAGLRVRVREVAMTDILAVLTGRAERRDIPGMIYDKALVGLMGG